jgi:hypothetical protein
MVKGDCIGINCDGIDHIEENFCWILNSLIEKNQQPDRFALHLIFTRSTARSPVFQDEVVSAAQREPRASPGLWSERRAVHFNLLGQSKKTFPVYVTIETKLFPFLTDSNPGKDVIDEGDLLDFGNYDFSVGAQFRRQ